MKSCFRRILPVALVATISLAPGVHATAVSPIGPALNVGSSNTVDSADQSAAIGQDNTVGNLSLAVGSLNTAWADYSMAFGQYNVITSPGESSAILGSFSTIDSSVSAILLGDSQSLEREQGTLVAGLGNHIYTTTPGFDQGGAGNVLLGMNNTLNKATPATPTAIYGTVLLGASNTATSERTWAMGEGLTGQKDTVTLGTYNATVSGASLILGNGSYGTHSNALVVMRNGDVVIPNGTLTIGSESAMTPTSVGSYLSTNKYLKNSFGTSSSASSGAFVAWGDSATSSGIGSVAIGDHAYASGSPSNIAVGYYAHADGTHAVAIQGGQSSGDYSFAVSNSAATGNYSVALGGSGATGNYSVALGGATSSGGYSFSTSFASAIGQSSVAIGGYDESDYDANYATGAGSTAIGGSMNFATGAYTFASGYRTTAPAVHSISMGSLNLGRGGLLPTTPNATNWVNDDVLFELGNGEPDYSPTQFSNAITTLKNGSTTLTNKFWSSSTPDDVPSTTGSSDGKALTVEGHSDLQGNLTVGGKTHLKGKVVIDDPQGDISMGIYD